MKKSQITTIAILFCLAISLSLPVSAAPQMVGETLRISLTNAGGQGNSASQYPAISPDGGYIAFQSSADNLVSNDTNGVSDIFVRDTAGGKTIRISVASDGSQANGASNFPAISVTGRWVAFESAADNLVSGDTNNVVDIFLHDRDTDADGIYDEAGFISTTRISVNSSGTQALGASNRPYFSPDGRYVAFHSLAANLVSEDNNDAQDIFVRDLQNHTTVRVSVNSAGEEGDQDSYYPSLSSGGRYVVFQSTALNLVNGDTNSSNDIFVHDRDTDADGIYDEAGAIQTVRLSVDSDGIQGGDNSYFPSISGDGRYVVFYSYASNLIDNDTNFVADVFLHDRDTDADGIYDEAGFISTTRISVSSTGEEANDESYAYRSISEDGRYVVYHSLASNLADNDTNGSEDVYLYDIQSGATRRISVATAGTEGNGDSYFATITANGKYVVFQSNATNLISSDTNDAWDCFRHENFVEGKYKVFLPFTRK